MFCRSSRVKLSLYIVGKLTGSVQVWCLTIKFFNILPCVSCKLFSIFIYVSWRIIAIFVGLNTVNNLVTLSTVSRSVMSIFLGANRGVGILPGVMRWIVSTFCWMLRLNFLDIFRASHVEFSLYFVCRVAVNILYILSAVFNRSDKNANIVICGEILV